MHLGLLLTDGKQNKSRNEKAEAKHYHCPNGKPVEVLLCSINLRCDEDGNTSTHLVQYYSIKGI